MVEVPSAPTINSQPRDLSSQVISLARVLDRLGAGDYAIHLEKPHPRAAMCQWNVTILRQEKVRSMELPPSNARK